MKRAYFSRLDIALMFDFAVSEKAWYTDLKPITASGQVPCAVGYIVTWWPK